MSASVVAFPERFLKPQFDKLEPFLNEAGDDSASRFELAMIGMRRMEAYRRHGLDTPAAQQGIVNAAFLAFAALGTMLGMFEPGGTIEEPPSSA